MMRQMIYCVSCLQLLLIGALAQTTPDIVEYKDGSVTWTNTNPDLYYTIEWQSTLTNENWTGSYRDL
jgi:hypothetical protein